LNIGARDSSSLQLAQQRAIVLVDPAPVGTQRQCLLWRPASGQEAPASAQYASHSWLTVSGFRLPCFSAAAQQP
jgi:hypothetical protein